VISDGQVSDYNKACEVLSGQSAEFVLADRGYAAGYFVEEIEKIGAIAVIPPKKNRLILREYDEILYKERNQVERLFAKMKHYRRFATRYEKLAVNFLGFVYFIGIRLWLK
jgi:transposase